MAVEKFEIVVWCDGRLVGDRFLNQTEEKAKIVNQAVFAGSGFTLIHDDNSMMIFAPGKVTNVQVSSYYGAKP
jgi:hypothetical protein